MRKIILNVCVGMMVHALFGACTKDAKINEAVNATVKEEPEETQSEVLKTASTDLISSTQCRVRPRALTNCRALSQIFTSETIETAVPLRTVVTRTKSGNCATPYPLTLALNSPESKAVIFSYLPQAQAVIRRNDGMSITHLSIENASPWLERAVFSESCHVNIDVSFNELDIDSVQDAQHVIVQRRNELTAQKQVRDNLQHLLLYQKAYDLMATVAQHFYHQLTNETMDELRSSASASDEALLSMITSCDAPLSQAEKMNLVRLYAALPALGDLESTRKVDGTHKTLAEFLGENAQHILETVNQISKTHGAVENTSYEADYQRSVEEFVRAEARLALASRQLEAWLP